MKELDVILKKYSVNNVVVDKSIAVKNTFTNLEVSCFDDVRSAAFFAFGQSKILNENVALIINGEYLSNIYTVLTEAWFQKTNLIVIALFESIYEVKTNYLDRCLVFNCTFFDKDLEQFMNKIEDSKLLIGPKLINIISENIISDNRINYSNIIKYLENNLTKNDSVYVYDSEKIMSNKIKIHNIQSKYKYGILSKYVALCLNEKNKSILLCSSDCVKVDSNIFNNRYINENFKVIIVETDEIRIDDWCLSNKIKCVKCDRIDNNIIENFCKTNKSMVLIVKECV